YVGPQVPSVRLEGESHPPRDSDKVFDFEDVVFGQSAVICRSIVAPFALPLCGRSCESVAIPVAIAQVQPDCPVWPQHLANPAEYLNQLGDILLGRLLQADLTVHAVVSKPEVRRRGYDTLNRHGFEDVCDPSRVFVEDLCHRPTSRISAVCMAHHTLAPCAPVVERQRGTS